MLGSFSSEITLSKMVLGENTNSIFTLKLAHAGIFSSIHKNHAIDFLFPEPVNIAFRFFFVNTDDFPLPIYMPIIDYPIRHLVYEIVQNDNCCIKCRIY